MVEAAEYRYRDDIAVGRRAAMVQSRSRYLLAESLVRSGSVEVGLDVLPEDTAQVSLAKNPDMIETFSAHRSDEALTDGIQIGRARRNVHDLDA